MIKRRVFYFSERTDPETSSPEARAGRTQIRALFASEPIGPGLFWENPGSSDTTTVSPADTGARDEAYFSTEELQRHARALFEQGEGSCSLDFEGGPGSCASGAVSAGDLRNKDFYKMKDDLEKKAKKLGDKVAAPNVNFFKSKKDFEAFHLRPGGSEA